MAAKKRRKRGLSGSPEHHRDVARKNIGIAVEAYKEAKRYAVAGKCGPALANFHRGAVDQGVVIAHQNEGLPMEISSRHSIIDAFDAANAAIREKCVVKGGLSGMRRRRRR